MYGMIHRALRQMVLDTEGERVWRTIEQQAEIGPAHLISSGIYDDEITLRVLAAAAEILDQPSGILLYRFGRYWISFAELSSFGSIMNFTGADLESFIRNLDTMHRTVTEVLPGSRMPSFLVAEQQAGRIVVEYKSHRAGLEPFVEGLLVGLLDRFGLKGRISRPPADEPRTLFIVQYSQG